MAAVQQTAAADTQPAAPKKPDVPKKAVSDILAHLPRILISAAAVVAVAAIGLYAYGTKLQAKETIFPSVYLADVAVGGMTPEEAAAAVDAAVTFTGKAPTLQVELPDQTLTFEPEQMSYATDSLAAAHMAMAYGRSSNPIKAVFSYLNRSRVDVNLSIDLDLDESHIRSIIDQAAQKAYVPLEPSSITYDDAQKQLVIRTGTPSVELDADSLYDAVCQAYTTGKTDPIQWDYIETLPEAVDLAAYQKTLYAKPTDAYYDKETRTIVADIPGLSFDLDEAQSKVDSAKYGTTIQVKMDEVPADLTAEELDQQMFGYKLEGRTSPYRSAQKERTVNLELACQAINGMILNPDDIFSFNEVLGERTEEKGYLPAPVFGEGGMSEGGGICQVASTIFYTVLYADLETVERKEHSYPVDYVPKGMDAAIYWDEGQDYKFRNNKQNPIRIEAFLDGSNVNINFYGIKENDNYVVMTSEIFEKWIDPDEEIINPDKPAGYRQQVQWAAYGMKINAFQSVFNGNDELIRTQRYYTYHYSMCNKWEVSPDMATGLGSGGTVQPTTPSTPSTPGTPSEETPDPGISDLPVFSDPLAG